VLTIRTAPVNAKIAPATETGRGRTVPPQFELWWQLGFWKITTAPWQHLDVTDKEVFDLATEARSAPRALILLGALPHLVVDNQAAPSGLSNGPSLGALPEGSSTVNRTLLAFAAMTALVSGILTASSSTADPVELIRNGTFDSGTTPWWWTDTAPASVVDGRLCAEVAAGTVNPWDAIIGQNDLTLQAGQSYELSFDASASVPVGVLAKVQQQTEPWPERLSRPAVLGPDPQHFTYAFTSTVDSSIEQVAFQIGGSATPWTLCLDNVSLVGGTPPPVYVPDTGPRVRVNQVGYLPRGPKNATLVTSAVDPLAWQLTNADGQTVASGMSTPRGVDAASAQNVHTIDFTGFRTSGTGYRLTADGETSRPFDIGGDVYTRLRSDALQFFYIQRSGIAIDGALVGQQYARPAGHVGVAPNQGDTSVPCQPGVCDYRLDVRGGWYDAGDHGKYVVNGGIATYQLLSTFERTKNAASAIPGALGDGTLRLPERANAVPDILDEARWELEFLMRMQVPAGQPLAGMAHHKIHDQNWTGLPLAPQDDPQPRELHPPNTVATLNLAATAAQCGRLFALYDKAFASRCLASARTAYAAAKAHPDIYASPTDGNGGGTYDDSNASDEFYWAAAQLYLTTGETPYLTDLRASPHHTGTIFTDAGFNWPDTAALGRLDLATVPNKLPPPERQRIRDSVVAAANHYLAIQQAQPYGLPMPANGYFWGATSNNLNNAAVLATAYDITRDPRYRDATLQAVDYVFGRNALNHSYVTGWGTKSAQNQHSRIYGRQLNPNLPNPPPGAIAGGPNTALQDPFAANLLRGCVGQFCYVDDIQSYSTNEVAINWNSALTWISSFLADQRDAGPLKTATCKVHYQILASWQNAFITRVTVTNTGRTSIPAWRLTWSFTGPQTITHTAGATINQNGATATAIAATKIAPGRSTSFAFLAKTSLTNPSPELFTLNGSPCA
jgi:endoglucanase